MVADLYTKYIDIYHGNLAVTDSFLQVRGLTTPVGGTEEEALHIFFQGDTNRHVAEHALNKGSRA